MDGALTVKKPRNVSAIALATTFRIHLIIPPNRQLVLMLNSNVVRLVTAVLAIIIPGFSLIPVLALYIILGATLPESEEF